VFAGGCGALALAGAPAIGDRDENPGWDSSLRPGASMQTFTVLGVARSPSVVVLLGLIIRHLPYGAVLATFRTPPTPAVRTRCRILFSVRPLIVTIENRQLPGAGLHHRPDPPSCGGRLPPQHPYRLMTIAVSTSVWRDAPMNWRRSRPTTRFWPGPRTRRSWVAFSAIEPCSLPPLPFCVGPPSSPRSWCCGGCKRAPPAGLVRVAAP